MKVRRLRRYKHMAVFCCRSIGYSHFAIWATAWNKRLWLHPQTQALMRRAKQEAA
jgi:hypothetical protein